MQTKKTEYLTMYSNATDSNSSTSGLKWCGYRWEHCMEGGRKIHPDNPWMWYSPSCCRVDADGVLRLKLENHPNTVKYWNGVTYHPQIATGLVRSLEEFDYGTFSAEIMLPPGKNLWPSFWLTGAKHWPPEIDIMEAWSGDGSYFKWTTPQFPWVNPSWRTTTNTHYNTIVGNAFRKKDIGSKNISVLKQKLDPSENFVEYKCEWMPDSIKFYAGGKLVRTVSKNVSRELVENINGDCDHRMDVVFNLFCEDPENFEVGLGSEMLVKNFKHIPADLG